MSVNLDRRTIDSSRRGYPMNCTIVASTVFCPVSTLTARGRSAAIPRRAVGAGGATPLQLLRLYGCRPCHASRHPDAAALPGDWSGWRYACVPLQNENRNGPRQALGSVSPLVMRSRPPGAGVGRLPHQRSSGAPGSESTLCGPGAGERSVGAPSQPLEKLARVVARLTFSKQDQALGLARRRVTMGISRSVLAR